MHLSCSSLKCWLAFALSGLGLLGLAPARGAEQVVVLNGVSMTLQDVTSESAVYYTSMRLNRALNIWNVEATVSNKSAQTFTAPLVLVVDSAPGTAGLLQPDGFAGVSPVVDLSRKLTQNTLLPGQLSAPQTLSFGVSTGTPSLATRVFALPALATNLAVGFVRTLDQVGQPLGSVSVEETGPAGQQTNQTDAAYGAATLGEGPGQYTWKFSAPGFLPVWRRQTLDTNGVALIVYPRLTSRSTNAVALTPLEGVVISNATVAIAFASGSVNSNQTATLTPLTQQTLPALLPPGWSPLQAFWLEMPGPASSPPNATLQLWGPLNQGETGALVVWNSQALEWDVLQLVTSLGGSVISATLPGAGAYAFVVGDSAPATPPAPQVNQPLGPSTAPLPNTTALAVTGQVAPSSSPASLDPALVTGTAAITAALTNGPSGLASGLLLECDVQEQYQLISGTAPVTPAYANYIVGYQRPGTNATNTLQASFPIRPLRLFGPAQLNQASVSVGVMTPGPFGGVLLTTNGGQMVSGDAQLLAGVGEIATPQAMLVTSLNPTNFLNLATNLLCLRAFDLTVTGLLPGNSLALQLGNGPTNALLVVALVLSGQGVTGLEPVARLASDGQGRITSLETNATDNLPGINASGLYVLLQVTQAQALVKGIALNTQGQPAGGLVASLGPWTTLSRAPDGQFLLIAPAGDNQLSVSNLATGDTGASELPITAGQTEVTPTLGTAIAGLQVVSTSPTNNAVNVPQVTSITIDFSQPLNPATLTTNTVQLLEGGQMVPVSLSLDTAGTTATVLPNTQLDAATNFVVALTTNITDTTGRPLEGQTQFTFATVPLSVRDPAAQLIIYAPGATNLATNVLAELPGFVPGTNANLIVVYGTPGCADPGVPVVVANEGSGDTTTVISRPDGSFTTFVSGQEQDFISATFVSLNGARLYVPVNRQLFDDGSVGLYQSGGALEANGDGGVVQVTVPPNAIQSRTKFKLESLSVSDLETQVGASPDSGAVAGSALNLHYEGQPPTLPVSVSFSVPDLTALGYPTNQSPTNVAAAVAIVQPSSDGGNAFEMVGQMTFTPEASAQIRTTPPPLGSGKTRPHSGTGHRPMQGGDEIAGSLQAFLNLTPVGFVANLAFNNFIVPLIFGPRPVTIEGEVGYIPSDEFETLQAGREASAALGEASLVGLLPGLGTVGQVLFTASTVGDFLFNAAELNAMEPLEGALVTVSLSTVPNVGPPGRVQQGMVYATSDADGSFLAVAPMAGAQYLVYASHPLYEYKLVIPVNPVSFTGGSQISLAGVVFKDFYFSQLNTNFVPPSVSVAAVPAQPAAGQSCVVQITAFQPAAPPKIGVVPSSVGHQNLLTGATVSNPQISLTGVTVTTNGNTVIWTGTLSANAPIQVTLKYVVQGANSEQSLPPNFFNIAFTGTIPPTPNPFIPPPYTNDIHGPLVVETDPVNNGFVGEDATITVQFNKPIDASVTNNLSGIVLSGPETNAGPIVRLSANQQTLTIQYPGLPPGETYVLTLSGQSIFDLGGKPLNQQPSSAQPVSFSLTFRTPPEATAPLPGLVNGVGSAICDNFLYALDQAPQGNYLNIYDISVPLAPKLLSRTHLYGAPRDLVAIPQYPYFSNIHSPPVTNDLVAVVGGDLTTTTDIYGNVTVPGQYLWVFAVGDGTAPQLIAQPIVSYRVASAVTKVVWSAPYLAYEEYGADIQLIGMVNLQALIIGYGATPTQQSNFPPNGKPGVDLIGDGEYVAPGDSPPLPQADPPEFYGLDANYVLQSTLQNMLDFSVAGGGATVGITLTSGLELDIDNDPTSTNLPPMYRTLVFNGLPLNISDPSNACVAFGPGAYPRWVSVFNNLSLINTNGVPIVRSVALVSLEPDSDSTQKLAVIDISLPQSPQLLNKLPLPDSLLGGPVESLTMRSDGFLLLAGAENLLVLNPSQLLVQNVPPGQLHPAIVDVIVGAGSATRSFGATGYGVYAVADGGLGEVIESPPVLQFVNVPTILVNPTVLAGFGIADVNQMLTGLRSLGGLPPANVKTNLTLNITSDLNPPNPALHYYVLVSAPGSSGPTIELGLEALNSAGRPLSNRGPGYAPVRAVSDSTQQAIGQEPRPDCGAPIRSLTAYRMSNNPHSAYYNEYLSKPFALITEQISVDTLAQLKAVVDREILSSGYQLRAFIDPEESTNAAIGTFAAEVDTTRQMIYPVSPPLAYTVNQSYYPGDNPPPPGGAAMMPGTYGTVCAHSGEFRTEATDMVVPSPRMPIVIKRQIGSQDTYEGPFGVGWDFNYNQRITELDPELFPAGLQMPITARDSTDDSEIAASQDVLFRTGMGTMVVFNWMGTNMPAGYAPDPLVQQFNYGNLVSDYYLPAKGQGVFDLLVKYKDGRFERLTPDGTRYRYTPDGALETILDRFPNNRHDLTYDRNGWLVRIDDGSVSAPRFVQFGHFRRQPTDPDFTPGLDIDTADSFLEGKICRLLDYAGADVLYQYSNDGFLTNRLGKPVAGENGGFAGRAQTFYIYSGCQIVGVVATANGTPIFTVANGTSSTGKQVAQSGTGLGDAVQLTIPIQNSAASLANLTTAAGLADNSTTQFQFDKWGHPTSSTMAGPGSVSATTSNVFDPNGLLVYVEHPEGNTETMVYDTNNAVFRSQGNMISHMVDPGPRGGTGYTETFQYDPSYNLKSGLQTTPDGFTWTYALTPDNREVGSITFGSAGSETFGFNANGQLNSHLDVRGVQTTIAYDATTGFTTTRNLGTNVYTYSYSADYSSQMGMPDSITLPEGAPLQFQYNANLQKVEAKRGALVEEFGYDEEGHSSYHQQQLGDGTALTVRSVYDAKGFLATNLLDGVEVSGIPTTLEYDFTPDPLSRIKTVRYPQGTLQTFDYDSRGNVTNMTVGDYVEQYTVDLNNNVTAVTQGGDVVKQTVYDGLDRPVTITRKTGAQDETETRAYYPGGELQMQTLSDPVFGEVGKRTEDKIDEIGRTLRESVTGTVFSPTYQYTYTAGSVQLMGPLMTTTRTWNSAGYDIGFTNPILTTVLLPDGNGRVTEIDRQEDGATYSDFFTFDQQDNRTSNSDNLGLRFLYLARAEGTLLAATNANGHATTFSNSVLGELLEQRRADGMDFHFQHDPERHKSYTGDPSAGFNFGYDSDFRLATSTLRNGAVTVYGNFDPRNMPQTATIPGGNITMQWDLQKRLTDKAVSYQSTTYTIQPAYDALDRVQKATYQQDDSSLNTATYTYDEAGPLSSARFQEDGADLTVQYTYYDDGNRQTVTYPSGVTVNEHRDATGRLTGVSDGNGNIISASAWQGNLQPKNVMLGSAMNVLNQYEARGRLAASRATRASDGRVLAHMRYQYDAANNLNVRQFIHRGGKADNFTYDLGERVSEAQIGTVPLPSSSFAVPLSDRNYGYETNGLDYLTSTTSSNLTPNLPAFATNWTAQDAFLLPTVVDGFTRGPGDPMGYVTNAEIQARYAGATASTPLQATLAHNGDGDLVQIARADGLVEDNFFQPGGLRYRRQLSQNGTVLEDRRFVYDDMQRLLEEYLQTEGTNLLAGRYYYASSDAPDSADLLDPSSRTLQRYYYLKDNMESVIAVADTNGTVVERVWYDPFGQPYIEGRDTAAPTLQSITTGTNGSLLIGLSEPVWTAISDPGPGVGIIPVPEPSGAGVISVSINSTNLSGTLKLLPSSPGSPPYSVFLFAPSQVIPNLPSALVGWWPGDGGAQDVAGGHNGTLKGGATIGPGLINQAFLLNGASAFVSVPDAPALDFGAGDFTAALWANFKSTSGEQVLIEKWTPSTVSGWSFIKMPDNSLRLAMSDGSGNEVDVNSGPLSIPATNWIHYAVTRQGSQFLIYTNGVAVASGTNTASLNSTNSLLFGSRDGTSLFLDGSICEVTLFSRALSAAELTAVAGGVSAPGPITVTLNPGMLADEWGNSNQQAAVSFQYNDQPGQVLYDAEPAPSSAPLLARSSVGSPFLFHGQYFDYDTGLIYLRARFYDPYSGMFLEPDPLGYEDSVNLYTGMLNNPVGRRDPTGLASGEEIEEAGAGLRKLFGGGSTAEEAAAAERSLATRAEDAAAREGQAVQRLPSNMGMDKVANGATVAKESDVMKELARAARNTDPNAFPHIKLDWGMRPEGTRLASFTSEEGTKFWVKQVSPEVGSLRNRYATDALKQQASALQSLGDMAPANVFDEGVLVMKDAGKNPASIWFERIPGLKWFDPEYRRIWYQGSKRLGTVFHDIAPRNIGANGLIFDPVKPTFQVRCEQTLVCVVLPVALPTAGYILYENHRAAQIR
jgi:RHS repeat-associated protein